MNKVVMMGRLTRDVELRETTSGVKVASFTIAVNRDYKNDEGKYDADFFNCTAWRGKGEFVANYFGKGDMIAISGKLQNRSWEGDDGNKRYATDVVIDGAYFCGGKQENSKPTNDEFPADDFADAVDIDLPWED